MLTKKQDRSCALYIASPMYTVVSPSASYGAFDSIFSKSFFLTYPLFLGRELQMMKVSIVKEQSLCVHALSSCFLSTSPRTTVGTGATNDDSSCCSCSQKSRVESLYAFVEFNLFNSSERSVNKIEWNIESSITGCTCKRGGPVCSGAVAADTSKLLDLQDDKPPWQQQKEDHDDNEDEEEKRKSAVVNRRSWKVLVNIIPKSVYTRKRLYMY
mmetsp:Transcript_8647/g.16335  ORF Transcript_8647/g.16335 Transcript_8647/m.16335 type:complete len:213 (+) Transcript_8647:454-1092(+)